MTTTLSGVLLAWTAIYLTAVGFAAWALRQKTQDRGTNILGAMCGFLAVSSATLAIACWSAPGTGLLLARAGDAALLPVPILLMQYAAVERRAPLPRGGWRRCMAWR